MVDLKLVEYATYLVVSVVLTVWVGRTLYRNGGTFLADVLRSSPLAESVNRLLVVGFYLVSLGGAALLINADDTPATPADAVRGLATRVGIVLLMLGVLHFANLIVLNRLRRPAGGTAVSNWP